MKLKSRLFEPLYYNFFLPIHAHWDGLSHMLRGHRVTWGFSCMDLWIGHLGCISCENCPDTHIEDGEHVGLLIWGRQSMLVWWLGKKICGLVGHSLFQHPKSGGQYVEDELYCYRCDTQSKLRKVWPGDEEQRPDTDTPTANGTGTYQVH